MASDKETISEEMLEPSFGQMKRSFKDKDRMRLLKQMTEHWKFSCSQAKRIVELFQAGQARIDAAVLMHAFVVDPFNFDDAILALFVFDDEKAAVREGIGASS